MFIFLQKLASVCSVGSRSLDKALFARIQLLLSEDSPVSDILVQEAALKATAILVRKLGSTFEISLISY